MQPVEGPSFRWPVVVSASSSAVLAESGVTTGPGQCRQSVVAGYLLVCYPAQPRAVWPVFLCSALNRTTGERPTPRP